MIKIKNGGEPIAKDPEVTRAEFEALRRRVTELENRHVASVTRYDAEHDTVTPSITGMVDRNGKSNAERQRAYRERKKHG